jgi:NAD(P)H-dependent glutamate synthase small subunit
MGKVTGFLEFERLEEGYAPVAERVRHYKEFVIGLDEAQARQQGARCMDCGTPFCNNGCPVHNIIPDFNDLVYRGDWKNAFAVLDSTNNFPEFTGRICPAPCEAACVLNINNDPIGIKSIEHAIIDRAWDEGWVAPRPAAHRTGKKVAVVGSGPAGMAAAQQLARAGHDVTLFEKNDRIGGLLRYGIPDFKLDKSHIDRRVAQMQAEGVAFRTGVLVGGMPGEGPGAKVTNLAQATVSAAQLTQDFDAVLLTGGAEHSRDLPVPGRDLDGIHFAMELLPQQNRANAGDKVKDAISAKGKHVIVIGGGDTGSDCVGTSNRHGAKSVTQFEVMPMPPEAGEQAAGVALLAHQAAHQLQPRGGRRARVRHLHQGVRGRQRPGQGAADRADRVQGRQADRGARHREGMAGRPGAAGHGLHQPGGQRARSLRRGQGRARQRQGHHRRRRRLRHQRRQGVRGRRHATRAEPGGLGHPRRPPGGARGGRVPDGVERPAALNFKTYRPSARVDIAPAAPEMIVLQASAPAG